MTTTFWLSLLGIGLTGWKAYKRNTEPPTPRKMYVGVLLGFVTVLVAGTVRGDSHVIVTRMVGVWVMALAITQYRRPQMRLGLLTTGIVGIIFSVVLLMNINVKPLQRFDGLWFDAAPVLVGFYVTYTHIQLRRNLQKKGIDGYPWLLAWAPLVQYVTQVLYGLVMGYPWLWFPFMLSTGARIWVLSYSEPLRISRWWGKNVAGKNS